MSVDSTPRLSSPILPRDLEGTQRVYFASDHAGYDLKSNLIAEFEGRYDCVDLGPMTPARCDYPERAWTLANAVAEHEGARGVLICGTGIGVSIAANRHPKIRAALVHDAFTAEMSRAHNDAQVICLGARVLDSSTALTLTDLFLTTDFEGGRHQTRLDLIADLS
jgi:ribose 5-phosphate isomerase B